MVAGLTTLQHIQQAGTFEQIAASTATLANGLHSIAQDAGIPVQVNHQGTMFGMYFLNDHGQRISNYPSARQYAHTERYARFFWAMVERGVYLAPSQFEAGFVSVAHGDEEINATLEAARQVMPTL
jgi:glutamate-1-semialdehyde 2,1-aminomutase